MSIPGPYPSTIPISAAQARVNAQSALSPATQALLFTLSGLIQTASQLGNYNLIYTAGPLNQYIINQLTAVGYIVVDTSVTNNPAGIVYNYSISWTQLNWPPAGQPA